MTKELKAVALDELKPYENNPRVNDNAVGAVAESIKQCEYVAPIIVDEDMVILAGHTRLKALQELGRDTAEVMIVSGLSEAQKRKYRLLDNKTNELAMWDFDKLDIELADLDFESFDFGFAEYNDEGYGTDFTLDDSERSDICQITFYLHEEQKGLIEYAMSLVEDEVHETFGNQSKAGNELYEVVRQWAEQRR